jgi:hypothetical protein
MQNAAIKTVHWLRRNFGALFCGAIALLATWVAMRQSYHFGRSLASGKQSMAMWMAIIDTCTAVLPITAVSLIVAGRGKTGKALVAVVIGYMLFSMTTQIGFALSERNAKEQQSRAINQAAKDARAERNKLIEGQVRWNNGVVVQRGTMRSSRKEALELTERLIDKAGEFDASKIVVVPEDPVTSIATTIGLSERAIKIGWAIWAAVLVILAKPIFWGLATFYFHRARATRWPRPPTNRVTEATRAGVSFPSQRPPRPRRPRRRSIERPALIVHRPTLITRWPAPATNPVSYLIIGRPTLITGWPTLANCRPPP